VSYQVVREWAIPNGGFGRIVVIDSSSRTDRGMAALGEQLRYDTRNDRNAFIQIFGHARAAALRDKVLQERATPAELRFYDRHVLGSYIRNANTGFHALEYSLDGVNGTVRTLSY
jgi:hypothetical protein